MTYTIKLPHRHPGQELVVSQMRRFNIIACGRRWGKTALGIDLLLETALPGWPVAWFAPTYKLLDEPWSMMRRTLPRGLVRSIDKQQRKIELVGGGQMDFWTLDGPDGKDAGRGRKYKLIIVDEAAMIRYLPEIWEEALRPTLVDMKGSAIFLSTPKGRNYFWELFQKGLSLDEPEWQSWQMPTSMNPFIDPEEIEAARKDATERRFAQEHLAEFLENEGAVFRYVREACTAHPQSHHVLGHAYVVGVDWGKSTDYTVFTVIDATTRELVYVDRSNKVSYSVQRDRLAEIKKKFPTAKIIAETNSIGEPIIDQLRADGIQVRGFTTTNASKSAIIEDLALAIEQRHLRLLDVDWLRRELLSFEMTKLPSGMTRYSAPEGTHDDGVMSLAIGWSGVGSGTSDFASASPRTITQTIGR